MGANLMSLLLKLFFFMILIGPSISKALGQIDAYFSPVDDISSTLISAIENAKKSIYAAVYCFTDKQIATALISAAQKGIEVKIIVDQMSTGRYGKAEFLSNGKVPVFIYSQQDSRWNEGPLMHHKFAIFDNEYVWTGSFNWTLSGNTSNQENVVCIASKPLAAKFKQVFNLLLKTCIPFGLYKSTKDSLLREEVHKLLQSFCSDKELVSNLQELLHSYSFKTPSTARAGAASSEGI